MTEQILTTLKQTVSTLNLQPDTGGCFEVTVDGDLLYSKLKTGEFPDEREIVKQLERRAAV